jgi:hypothetical protein
MPLFGRLQVTRAEVVQDHAGLVVPDMMARLYWGRIWTLQEVALSQAAWLYCGRSAPLPYHEFYTPRALNEGLSLVDISGHGPVWSQLREMNDNIDYYFGRFHNGKTPDLSETRRYESTDPRDKIYGLRAMVPALRNVVVNYGLPFQKVYMDAMTCFLRSEGNLKAMNLIAPSISQSMGASWVPDFTIQAPGPSERWEPPFNPPWSGHPPFTIESTQSGSSHLQIKGIEIDEISICEAPLPSWFKLRKVRKARPIPDDVVYHRRMAQVIARLRPWMKRIV